VNLVRLLFDAADVDELKARMPGEVFQDVGDETYPAVKGAKKRLREENAERVLKGEKERPYPDSHTLACVYEALHKFYPSLLATSMAFNSMMAQALRRPAWGCVGPVRDGSRCYGDQHIQDVNHKARRLIARDPDYRRLLKEAQSRDQISEYCKLIHSRVREEEAEKAVQAYPELVQNGCFVGVLSTNSMEGGNWRMKFGLRVPYIDTASLEARAVLLAIADSARTFAKGRPWESFAHRHGCFEYSSVMMMTVSDRADRSRDPSCAGGGDGGSSGENAPSHTEEFVLWLNAAVLRAKQRKEQAPKAPATTN
jgi:hypothetical protein